MKAGLFKSISEARKTIKSGGVYLNNARVEDEEQTLGRKSDFLHGRFALIRRGKKALGAVEQRVSRIGNTYITNVSQINI